MATEERAVLNDQGLTMNSEDPLIRHCQDIAKTPVDDVQKIGSLMQNMIIDYYRDVRTQASSAFRWALIIEIVAMVFFAAAAAIAMEGKIETAALTAVSGFLIQLITGVVFYLYSQTAKQFAGFHICLERTNRFLLANGIVQHLPVADRGPKRAEVISTILNAPMLTLGMLEKGV